MERLPAELTNNILSRLPFKSTGQCKCVSKQWNSLLSDPKFLNTQLTKLSKLTPDILLFYKNPNSPKSGTCYLEDNEDKEPFLKNRIKPFKKYDHQFIPESFFRCAAILGSCNGFICVSDQSMFDISHLPRNPIYVANPITGERSSLPHYKVPKLPGGFPNIVPDLYLSGFVYNECKEEFKLVLVMFTLRDFNKPQDFKNEVQVCTLGSNVWKRKTGVVPDVLRLSTDIVSSAYVNKCVHWVTIDGNSSSDGIGIVSFNVELQGFDFVPSPVSGLFKLNYPHGNYKLGVLKEKLSVVKCFIDGCIQVCVMEKYGVKESWVKKFSIQQDFFSGGDMDRCHVELIKFRKNGELLLLCGNEILVSYNTKTQKCRSLKVGGVTKGFFLLACPFVGRLNSLKLTFGMESEAMESSLLSGELNFLAPFMSR